MAQVLTSMSAVTIESAYQELLKTCIRFGASGAPVYALSAFDIALHDLMGQRLGVPVSTFLGGALFDRMPLYSSPQMRNAKIDAVVEHAEQCLAAGIGAIKLHTGKSYFPGDVARNTVEWVRALRKIWPTREDLGLMVDVNTGLSAPDAVRVGRELERLDVTWFEEPISQWDHAGYRQIQQALDIPVAAGELNCLFWQFRDSVVEARLDIIQPNLTKCGGFSVGRRVGALAEAFNKPIASHNNEPSLMTAIHVQYWMATKMCEMPQEYCGDGVKPLRDTTPILLEGTRIEDGFAFAPDGPGLGVTLDEERIRAEATQTIR
jgi:L-alanine-DL-glutamate epimerase-like enolase superfamily enzyme